MSLRFLLAFGLVIGFGQINTNESLAQFNQNQPVYQYPQYQQQPMMSGPVNRPGMYQAAARMRQDQAMQPQAMQSTMQPRAPMVEAPVYQAPQNGFTAPPPLAPSMVAPSCGSNYAGNASCGCTGGSGIPGYTQSNCDSCSGGSQIGKDYFGCGEGCGAADDGCGCSERYLRVFGGWNWLQDVESSFQTAPQQGRTSFNDGWAIGGAIGKYMTANARRELEFTYRNNTAETAFTPAPVAIDGFVNAYSLMGNLVYELPALQMAGLKPYLGGGVGVAYIDGEFAGGFATIDDTAFAYQGFFGVDRQLSAQTKLFAEYRYFATSEVDIDAPVPTSDEYEANNLFFGVQLTR